MSYSFEKENNLMAEGDYEAVIEKIETKTLDSGKEKLWIMYRIRSDVEGQKYGNKCLFEDIWREKDSPEHFNRRRINQLLGTQDFVKEGQVFETIQDVIDSLRGANLIIHVGVEFSDYKGEDINKVSYYKSSKYKPQTLTTAEAPKEIEISDEDMPF